ncbi:hypothetical protein ES332_D11G307500v1 [Gossypium tomentosum]|uniref:Uncharacterized protein n=1 Tax=Gossypium tomentosum TaxID=34277 RepID=A0A5D2IVD1_GOSTO|nr:hypothetical protein ES332_D11G307500v1 [Gossypium tomentosum]
MVVARRLRGKENMGVRRAWRRPVPRRAMTGVFLEAVLVLGFR